MSKNERPPSTVPHMRVFQKALAKELGTEATTTITETTKLQYCELIHERELPSNKALAVHLDQYIFPGLALYKALRAQGMDPERALSLVRASLEAWALRTRRFVEIFGRMPFYFWAMRRFIKKMVVAGFPPEGWRIEWLEVSNERIAFNMKSCFYLETLIEYGAPELAPLYCDVDDMMHESSTTCVKWKRLETIARGDDLCDFQFIHDRSRS